MCRESWACSHRAQHGCQVGEDANGDGCGAPRVRLGAVADADGLQQPARIAQQMRARRVPTHGGGNRGQRSALRREAAHACTVRPAASAEAVKAPHALLGEWDRLRMPQHRSDYADHCCVDGGGREAAGWAHQRVSATVAAAAAESAAESGAPGGQHEADSGVAIASQEAQHRTPCRADGLVRTVPRQHIAEGSRTPGMQRRRARLLGAAAEDS